MSENNVTEKKNSSAVKILLIILIIVVVVVGGVIGAIFLLKDKNDSNSQETGDNVPKLAYEDNVVIIDDKDALQKAVDEMHEKAEKGNLALEFKENAISTDGKNFVCSIGNSEKNYYDMYIQLIDVETNEEIYLSGLIPLGSQIEQFESNIEYEKGDHKAYLILTQVDEDHSTIVGQVTVYLTLTVE